MANGLVPDIGFQLGRGVQTFGQLQQQQLLREQAAAQAAQQQQLQGLLGQITLGQQPVPQLGAQAPVVQPQAVPQQLGVQPAVAPQAVSAAQPAITQQQARQQLETFFPQQAQQIAAAQKANFENRTAREKQRITSVVQSAAGIQGLPVEQQIRKLEQNRERFISQNIPTNDTDEQLRLLRAGRIDEANVLTDQAVQLGQSIGVLQEPPSLARASAAEIKRQEKQIIDDLKAEETDFDRAQKLRSEISKVSSDFNKISAANSRIEAVSKDPSAAGDLALIFNFMKMLDPGSVVRESEFATAQNSAGVPDRIRNQYNRALTGERLTPQQREDFLDQSQKIFIRSQKDNEKAVNKIVDIGKQFGVSRDQLLGREQPTTTQVGRFTVEAE